MTVLRMCQGNVFDTWTWEFRVLAGGSGELTVISS